MAKLQICIQKQNISNFPLRKLAIITANMLRAALVLDAFPNLRHTKKSANIILSSSLPQLHQKTISKYEKTRAPLSTVPAPSLSIKFSANQLFNLSLLAHTVS